MTHNTLHDYHVFLLILQKIEISQISVLYPSSVL